MLLRRAEFHTFSADGAPHVYLIPSAAVFRLDGASAAVLDTLASEDLARAGEPWIGAEGRSERSGRSPRSRGAPPMLRGVGT